ncbi:MAG: ATP-binding protein [Clostridiaceae bacterium]|jgi:predicted AAA+ superfamily ATPase|nr:ATP-binding protein [Clostridiaceae bacterium]
MYFQRKLYYKLLEWKNEYADSYALLIEGARRVGKSTLVEKFATNEYKAYILIDFANVAPDVLDSFDDIHDLDLFYLRLQAATGKTLIENDSVIIFDEIQLFPKARQAIKYLVQDGRYHFIETGSLISIKKNVQNILIPSEEMRISMHPMDFEEFCWAIESNTYKLALEVYLSGKPLGQNINRKWMKDYRIYMAVGGMPQAVKAYVQGENFSQIDHVKRTIIDLYENDFKKIDRSGRISAIYRSVPSQLAIDTRRFYLSKATEKRKTNRDEELLYELIDSKTVIPCYNTRDPVVSLSQTKDLDTYKLYLADTGLFISLMFIDRPGQVNSIYMKLLSDKLPANLGLAEQISY